MSSPHVTAVVLAYLEEPLLGECVEALLGSSGVVVDVVVVDNGCTDGAVEPLRAREGVTVLDPGRNTGFAGGCNLAAGRSGAAYLAFVNADALVSPAALGELVAALDPSVGLATASLRLADRPDTMNSCGNPVHFSGLSWAGGLGEPAARHGTVRDVASASGAATVVRRDRFEALGGFYEEMFAYCEDTELSLRCWQRGWRVVYVPTAVVRHRYEFARNPRKNYLLERNRLLLVLTTYEARTLLVLAPALLALELAVLATALRQGWAAQKVQGWGWLWAHRAGVRARRARTQRERRVGDRRVSALLTGDFHPAAETGLVAPPALRRLSRAYWAVARSLLASGDAPPPEEDGSSTAGEDYADRLVARSGARWKQVLDVQRPYRWNLERLDLGVTLDVGCGIGRNLHHLPRGSVGVDHNAQSVRVARGAGLVAHTSEEFWREEVSAPGRFDSMLLAHVVEHVSAEVAEEIVAEYLPCLRPGGTVVLITPQEVGYRSDPTHVRFVDLDGLRRHAGRLGLTVRRAYSFPFPRPAGKVFTYNEFVLVATTPSR